MITFGCHLHWILKYKINLQKWMININTRISLSAVYRRAYRVKKLIHALHAITLVFTTHMETRWKLKWSNEYRDSCVKYGIRHTCNSHVTAGYITFWRLYQHSVEWEDGKIKINKKQQVFIPASGVLYRTLEKQGSFIFISIKPIDNFVKNLFYEFD